MQAAGAPHGLDDGLAHVDGMAHGHGYIIGVTFGAPLIVEELLEERGHVILLASNWLVER